LEQEIAAAFGLGLSSVHEELVEASVPVPLIAELILRQAQDDELILMRIFM
jgi:hypothetical protein